MTPQRQQGFAWIIAVVAAVWLLLGAADWVMRFRWFHWQQNFWVRPTVAAVADAGSAKATLAPVTRGGDLSHLIGIESVAGRFEEERPPTAFPVDEYGYRNEPPTEGRQYPVVVVGASYLVTGFPMTNMFSQRLAADLGVPVYNHAVAGRGPLFGLVRFMQSPRFFAHPPKVLVWGIVEREIGGPMFGALEYQIRQNAEETRRSPTSAHVVWRELTPAALKASLPNSSLAAQFSDRLWNRIRYDVFGRLNPDVAVATRDVAGGPLLFYTPAVTALKWGEARKLPEVVYPIQHLQQVCRERGITLMILLIPDKEQVYREYLPRYLDNPQSPIPESCLMELTRRLEKEGIPVVNCLPLFSERALQGELLYWRDDTHWNARAIGLAAELVAARLGGQLTAPATALQ